MIVVIKDESNGDPAEPKSEGGEGEQPYIAHLKQTSVKNKQTTIQTSKITNKQDNKQGSKQTNKE